MSIVFENPSLAPALKKLVSNMKGVKKVTVNYGILEIPNAKTRSAINELKAGKGFRCKSTEQLFEELNN